MTAAVVDIRLAPADHALLDWWLGSRQRVGRPRRKGFDSLFLLVVWHLWLERNARVFQRRPLQPTARLRAIAEELHQWCLARIVSQSQLLPA